MEKQKKADEKTFYYVNPNSAADPVAKVFCTNNECVNFIPIHQTCNLKIIMISPKGSCEFSVKRKNTKLKAHAKQTKKE